MRYDNHPGHEDIMGNRLSKIYTRTGDAGTTGLGDGKRVSKNSLRIHALGEVDETNAIIGLLLCEVLPEDVRVLLTNVQHDLFDLGGEVCIPGMSMITGKQVTHLEEELDRFNEPLEPLKDFILPGGTRAAAFSFGVLEELRRIEVVVDGHADGDARARTGVADGVVDEVGEGLAELLWIQEHIPVTKEVPGLHGQSGSHSLVQGDHLPDQLAKAHGAAGHRREFRVPRECVDHLLHRLHVLNDCLASLVNGLAKVRCVPF